jgi:hypothetical protein
MLVAEAPVTKLVELLQRRPELASSLQYLLIAAVGADKAQLAANRELIEGLLNHPEPQIQDAAKTILANSPEPPTEPTPEISSRLTAGLRSPDDAERRKALLQTIRCQAATPEMREALAAIVRQDTSVSLRIDARIELERLSPNDPALAAPSAPERENATRELLSRFDRKEASVTEMLTAVADGTAEPISILGRLPGSDPSYWMMHQEEKILLITALASLHRERDAGVYEAASEAYARLNQLPRQAYSFNELAGYFAAMESALTPGEYAIAMRDLKSSLDSYWQAHRFAQPEPSHLPADLVKVLLVGPYHQNRPAYEQMLHAMREIDPGFKPTQQQ